MNAYMTDTADVKKMTAALIGCKQFKVEQTEETVRATFELTKETVFAALKKGASEVWIVREHEKLWQ